MNQCFESSDDVAIVQASPCLIWREGHFLRRKSLDRRRRIRTGMLNHLADGVEDQGGFVEVDPVAAFFGEELLG